MIEIALARYADIFNKWDPAPFKRRDLDPDLALYLEGSAEEIPVHHPIELYFIVLKQVRNEALEAEAQQGLKNSFLFKRYLVKKELRKTNTQMLRCVLLGFIFLGIGTVFSNRMADTIWLSLLGDALLIGGWVFLWEAVSLFFFTNRELYDRYQVYKRLQNAPVMFREAEKLSYLKIK